MTSYSQEILDKYKTVTTATITTVLLKHHGLKNVWVRGVSPLISGQERVAGPAFTLRFIPAREDLCTAAAWSAPISTRSAIEAMPEGCIAVLAAGACSDAGVLGDILCQCVKSLKVAALLSDGVLRDLDGIRQTGLGVWAQGVAAPPAITSLAFINWQEPVGCGGVAIIPNDLIVADNDGAVVIPSALVNEVLDLAIEQEELEAWILEKIKGGAPLSGLYPPNEDNKREYELYRRR